MELALIGYPIEHSRSPWIHQQFLEQTEIEGSYHLYQIREDEFDQEIIKLKSSSLTGFNVTIPYKEKIIPFLDGISPDAREIGAVNTVVCQDQKWYGHNTDGLGLTTAIKTQYPDVFAPDKSVLILGAGGASRGIYHALLKENFHEISIANRTISRAKSLMALNQTKTSGTALSFADAEQRLADFDLIIQTTSVGMKPNINEQVIDLSRLKSGTVVSDIVYQPFWTRLLQNAKQKGGRIHHGHEMLIYQAKHAFELWSNKEVSVNPLLKEFLELTES